MSRIVSPSFSRKMRRFWPPVTIPVPLAVCQITAVSNRLLLQTFVAKATSICSQKRRATHLTSSQQFSRKPSVLFRICNRLTLSMQNRTWRLVEGGVRPLRWRSSASVAGAGKTGHIGNGGQDSSLGPKIATILFETQEFRHSRDHCSQTDFELTVNGEADQSFLMPRITREHGEPQGRAAADQRPKGSRAVSGPKPGSSSKERSSYHVVRRQMSMGGDNLGQFLREFIHHRAEHRHLLSRPTVGCQEPRRCFTATTKAVPGGAYRV